MSDDDLIRRGDALALCSCGVATSQELRALPAVTPAVVADETTFLTEGIREAIRLAEQPHYGDTGTALDHYGEAVEVLRKLLEKKHE